MEGDLPFSLINPFARCPRFPKMWSNNPFGAPRQAFGSPTPSHDHIFEKKLWRGPGKFRVTVTMMLSLDAVDVVYQ